MFDAALKGWSIAALSLSIIFLSTFVLTSQTGLSRNPKTQTPAKAEEQKELTTSLSLSPREVTAKVKGQQTISLNINTEKDNVAALKLHLSFDPKVMKVDSIAPSAFFEKASILHKEIDNKTGKVIFVFGSIEPKAGSGEAAVIRLSTLTEGVSELEITSESEVAATGKTYNVVKSTGGATLKVTK